MVSFEKIKSFSIRWYKWVLFAVIIPLPTYSLMMVNQLSNDVDGLWHGSISYAGAWELAEGRWLWRYLDKARLYLSPDPLTSLISLFMLAIAAVIILELYGIKKTWLKAAILLLFMVNPTVGCFLSYRYMSPTFTTSVLLATVAAFFAVKLKNKILSVITFAVLLAMSMGLYQANIGCAAFLMLLDIVAGLYKERYGIKEALTRAARYILSIICGGGLYIAIWNIELYRYDVEKSSYNGADQYTIPNMIMHLPQSFIYATRSAISYLLSKDGRALIIPRLVFILLAALLVILAVCAIYLTFRKDRIRALLLTAALILLPAASGGVLFLSFNEGVQTQMTMPFVLFSAMMLYMIDMFSEGMEFKNKKIDTMAAAVAGVLTMLILYGAHIQLQYDEQAMYMGRQSMTTMVDQMIDTCIAKGMYGYDYRYCFIGSPADSRLFIKNDVIAKSNGYGKYGDILADAKQARLTWTGFFNNELGIDIRIVDEDVYQSFMDSEEVKAMPEFPAEGSVAQYDDCVVIKVAQW